MGWKIKNRKFALLSLVLFCLFIYLGTWQMHRADEKLFLLRSFKQRAHQVPLQADKLSSQHDLRFYRAQLNGFFDNEHTILLDNKIHQGKVGYEVYTPFRANGLAAPILVDRGFVESHQRNELPNIPAITDETVIIGLFNEPPRFAALGEMIDGNPSRWPLRVEFIDLRQISEQLKTHFFPYILILDPKHTAAFDLQWEIVVMSPERHQGYALQWFAFALTLLILFVALNVGRVKK